MASERRRLYLLALLAILLLAAALRFYRLDASSLWSDEGNSWAMLSRSYGAIAQAAAADIHPPGYYWLLKLWSSLFGASAWAMRSFSAAAGVLLVLVVERIARLLAPAGEPRLWLPLLAALVAATNPLQIYYSQEARMYMLLALAAAGLFWALLAQPLWQASAEGSGGSFSRARRTWLAAAGYVLCAAVGLWTHYSFAIVLAAANLAWLARWLTVRRQPLPPTGRRSLWGWLGLNALALAAFLSWLPVAVNSVLHWPKGGVAVGPAEGLELILRALLLGPLHSTPLPLWPWLAAAALLPAAGVAGLVLTQRRFALPLALWLGLPILLMGALGLFTDAFLKFLLTASPAWCLLVACTPLVVGRAGVRRALALGVALFAAVLALLTLPAYYQDAVARDNYQGVAAYLAAAGDPARDLVILDAPGQQEVWRYYDPGLPFLALPTTRPPAAEAVDAALSAAAEGRRRIYALFWATDEADAGRLVESWLDRNAFKSLDVWQGNLRLAAYTLAGDLQPLPMTPVPLGDAFVLAGQAQPDSPPHVVPGDAALVQLRWQVLQDVRQRYKVSVQLLDAAGQVVAQRDSEPAGGSRPTDGWRAGEQILDNYALPIGWGTPPGEYRLQAAVYDAVSGERLTHSGGDAIALGSVRIDRPQQAAPAALIPMAQRLNQPFGPVTLLGYDAYRQGFAHAPQTPLQPGDMVQFVFYWQAPDPLPAGWPAELAGTLRLGDQSISAPLAGAASGYPTSEWQPGEIVRGQVSIPYDGSSAQPQIEVAGSSFPLAPLPH